MWAFHPAYSPACMPFSPISGSGLWDICTVKLIHHSLRKLLLLGLDPVDGCLFRPHGVPLVKAPFGSSGHGASSFVHDFDKHGIVGLGSKGCTVACRRSGKVCFTRIGRRREKRVVEGIASADECFVLQARELVEICITDGSDVP